MLSFTGSAAVGWQLKAQAGKKRVTLELGGNAAVLVHEDADLDLAAQKIVAGGIRLCRPELHFRAARLCAEAALADVGTEDR